MVQLSRIPAWSRRDTLLGAGRIEVSRHSNGDLHLRGPTVISEVVHDFFGQAHPHLDFGLL